MLRFETRRLFNKARNSCLPLHCETFRNAQRRYSREIVRNKRSSCREFCENVESAPEASRLNRILSSDNHIQLGCLKPTMGYTINLTEFIEYLMKTGFPGFRTVDNHSTAHARRRDVFKARDWSLAAKIVYLKGVEWAVKTFKPYKSPGPDGIYSACLQEGLGLLISPLVKVFRANIVFRHMPIVGSGTRVTFISKLGRNGHILAKDFRSISLAPLF
ncbi:uncharacterized protein LOC112638260 [Camponotus floridanus]|uniref:uncharacterized protein LOC105248574 n=1 Tax=Camponotus floridanus TaxID=104421 RepID=UPI00059BE525|nr:uncharacterized protein LOC105248574 [Camponotus floridanus]XP_025265418.1 uncharacterized protein LOC112638259 [Camponotus floridanus]XP_025265419.1 uncharacterized protein LOC112638260 [Camponotus floridanus]